LFLKQFRRLLPLVVVVVVTISFVSVPSGIPEFFHHEEGEGKRIDSFFFDFDLFFFCFFYRIFMKNILLIFVSFLKTLFQIHY